MGRRFAQYKYHHDRNVHFEPNFVPDQWMFVAKPTITSGRNTADGMTKANYNKLR